MESKRLTDEEFLNIFKKVPRLCIDLLIETDKGILFTKRSIEPYKEQWHLPGGSVLMNETLEESVKRIGKYELGVEVKSLKLEGVVEFFNEGERKTHSVSLVFNTQITSGDINLNEEASDFLFSKEIPENTISQQADFIKKFHKQ